MAKASVLTRLPLRTMHRYVQAMDASKFLPGNEEQHAGTRRVELGELVIASGRLAFHDPFEARGESAVLLVRPGRYRVWATEIDEARDSPDAAESYLPAYLSIQLTDAEPDWVAPADELGMDVPSFGLWTGTDSGVVGVFDADALTREELAARSAEWDRGIDAEDNPHRFTYVNIPLSANVETNIIVSKSGWGDGGFAILATYDIDGNATAIHVDFRVVDTDCGEVAAAKAASKSRLSVRSFLQRMFKRDS